MLCFKTSKFFFCYFEKKNGRKLILGLKNRAFSLVTFCKSLTAGKNLFFPAVKAIIKPLIRFIKNETSLI